MLAILFQAFIVINSYSYYFPPLLSSINMLRDSLFSTSKKGKLTRSIQKRLKNYKFRQANNSLTDPLLYTFKNANIELEIVDSDKESKSNDEHSVRTRHLRQNLALSAHDGGSIVIIERPVLPNETIQAFAIRHRVPVSQLKLLNNVQNDQEFYVLKYCRVPAHRFGIFHDSYETSSSSSSTATTTTLIDFKEQSTLSLPVTHLSQQNHLAFLNGMDQDLALIRTKVKQLVEGSSTAILASPSVLNSRLKSVTNTTTVINCDGTDCGCRSVHIIIIIILIALIPIIFVYFYIKYYHSE